jgi:TolA-binding protein
MAREKITLDDITDLDLNIARNEKAIAAATEIRALPPEKRRQRLKELRQNIQQGTASLFEERVVTLLLEPRGAERILTIQRHLPRIEKALKSRSGSQRISETPTPEAPSASKVQPKTATSSQYPSDLLDFLASQKPPTPPSTSISSKPQGTMSPDLPSRQPSTWSRRDQVIVAVLAVLLGVALFYGFLSTQISQTTFLTFDQQARQQDALPDQPTLSPEIQAEFDAAMQALRSGDFAQGKAQTLAFIEQHPQTAEAEAGYLALADTSRQRQHDPDIALIYYQTLLEQYPQSSSKGLVQLKMGFAYEDMEDSVNAEAMYRLVLDQHGSQSRLGQLANQRLHALTP